MNRDSALELRDYLESQMHGLERRLREGGDSAEIQHCAGRIRMIQRSADVLGITLLTLDEVEWLEEYSTGGVWL